MGRRVLNGPGNLPSWNAPVDSSNEGQVLPDRIRDSNERSLGVDLSKVRIFAGDSADRMAQGLGARAFTCGERIGFRKGQYDPESRPGRALLEHELAHVAQQTPGNNVIQCEEDPPTSVDRVDVCILIGGSTEDKKKWRIFGAQNASVVLEGGTPAEAFQHLREYADAHKKQVQSIGTLYVLGHGTGTGFSGGDFSDQIPAIQKAVGDLGGLAPERLVVVSCRAGNNPWDLARLGCAVGARQVVGSTRPVLMEMYPEVPDPGFRDKSDEELMEIVAERVVLAEGNAERETTLLEEYGDYLPSIDRYAPQEIKLKTLAGMLKTNGAIVTAMFNAPQKPGTADRRENPMPLNGFLGRIGNLDGAPSKSDYEILLTCPVPKDPETQGK